MVVIMTLNIVIVNYKYEHTYHTCQFVTEKQYKKFTLPIYTLFTP